MPRFVLRHQVAPEPTSRLPLTWGDYRSRYVVGIALLIAGAALVSQTTAYTFTLGLIGSAIHVAGWLVQPGRPGPRTAVALPSMIVCWATISGPKTMWLLAICLACWLVVRRRPGITYLAVLLPLAVGLFVGAIYSHAGDKSVAFAATLAAVVAGAWLAREYALRVRLTTGAAVAQDTP